ncbi:hypothetical protein QYF61_007655 [Mycteria americana]|uniref:Uncharacterized protein n=1 Tax=Mycteria americana TaxID=33587 RepID=A0AAN7NQV0_MYCAM|nr:hypothetical protein QYF61_007655 [Mycteria americana]
MKLMNKLEHLSYEEAERTGTFQPGEKKAREDLTNMGGSYPMGDSKDDKKQPFWLLVSHRPCPMLKQARKKRVDVADHNFWPKVTIAVNPYNSTYNVNESTVAFWPVHIPLRLDQYIVLDNLILNTVIHHLPSGIHPWDLDQILEVCFAILRLFWENLLEADCVPQHQPMANCLQDHNTKEIICCLWELSAALRTLSRSTSDVQSLLYIVYTQKLRSLDMILCYDGKQKGQVKVGGWWLKDHRIKSHFHSGDPMTYLEVQEQRQILGFTAETSQTVTIYYKICHEYNYSMQIRGGEKKKKKSDYLNNSQRRGVRICESNNPADTKVSEEGGERGALGTGAEILLQPVVKTMVRQAVPLQPMEVNSGADIHLQPVEDLTPEQMDVPERCCDSVESLHWSGLLTGPVDPWREKPMGRTHVGEVCGELSPVGGTPHWSRGRVGGGRSGKDIHSITEQLIFERTSEDQVVKSPTQTGAKTLVRVRVKPHPRIISHPEALVHPACVFAQDTTLKNPKSTI